MVVVREDTSQTESLMAVVENHRQGLKILRQMTPYAQKVIWLYYFQKLSQYRIAEILGIEQPSVFNQLDRARKQIRYFYELSVLRLPEDLEGIGFTEDITKMLISYYFSSSQSVAAREIGRSQGYVRHQIQLAIRRLQDAGRNKVADTLSFVAQNLNIVHNNRHRKAHKVAETFDEVEFPADRVVEVLNLILSKTNQSEPQE